MSTGEFIFFIFLFFYIQFKIFLLNRKLNNLHKVVSKIISYNEIQVNTFNKYIKDFSNGFIIKSKKVITGDEIKRIIDFLQKDSNHKKPFIEVHLKCDICNHEWVAEKPVVNKIKCPHCELIVEYEILE